MAVSQQPACVFTDLTLANIPDLPPAHSSNRLSLDGASDGIRDLI